MKKIIHVLCTFISAFFIPVLAQELPAIHYTTEKEINPLPNPAVTALHQDRLGFLWICSYGGGLVRYDGHKMEIYGQADSPGQHETVVGPGRQHGTAMGQH